MIAMDVKGIDELIRKFVDASEKLMAGLEKTLYREAQKVMTKSKRICPVDRGPLRASGHVNQPVRAGTSVTVDKGYGNSSVDYALAVHERLDVQHKPPTQAKFLEQPALEAVPDIEREVAAMTKAIWGV